MNKLWRLELITSVHALYSLSEEFLTHQGDHSTVHNAIWLSRTRKVLLNNRLHKHSRFKTKLIYHIYLSYVFRTSQWPHGIRRRSAAARLLRSWLRIPPVAWRFVCCECCVLSGKGLCDELITRPEEFYRLWCVVVCDLETSRMRRSWPALGHSATEKMYLEQSIVLLNAYFTFLFFSQPIRACESSRYSKSVHVFVKKVINNFVKEKLLLA